jgi:linoleoyl-CoA desaturase
VKFPRNENAEFLTTLRSRVNKYFKDNGISKYGDRRLYLKTSALLALYFFPYALIMFEVSDSIAVKFMLWLTFGLGLSGLGLSVMHDAVHGAYSSNKKVNQFFANVMVIIGGSKFTWNVQHNQKHHSYTNRDGIDEDIDPGVIMRFSPHKKRYGIHRLQHLYAWFFYGIISTVQMLAEVVSTEV